MGRESISLPCSPHPPSPMCPYRLRRAAPPPGPRLRPQEFGECAGRVSRVRADSCPGAPGARGRGPPRGGVRARGMERSAS